MACQRIIKYGHVDLMNVILSFCKAQGSLDLKYLAQRFEKGKDWVDDWMSTYHRYFLLPGGFGDEQAALIKFAHGETDGPRNPDPLLDFTRRLKSACLQAVPDCRLAALCVDSSWTN